MNHYTALFSAFREAAWFGGVFWWNWLSDPAFGGDFNYCYTVQFKPTEKLVRSWFGGISGSHSKHNLHPRPIGACGRSGMFLRMISM